MLGICFLLATLAYFGRRPFRNDVIDRELYPAVTYSRELKELPHPAVVHTVRIQLSPSVEFVTTPLASDGQYAARTVSQFAEELGTDIAINANFFFPFESNTPWDYYPLNGDPVTPAGLAISNGEFASAPRGGWAAFCVGQDQSVEIVSGRCSPLTIHAVGGQPHLLRNGQIVQRRGDELAPRTAIGLNEARDELILIVVDGRQPAYSEGVTLPELAEILADAGAHDAFNLDGGGSTTLVLNENGVQRVVNAPYHTRIVMRERPVANHLGLRFN